MYILRLTFEKESFVCEVILGATMKRSGLTLALILILGNCYSQKPDYNERISLIGKNLNQHFRSATPGLYKETNAFRNEKPFSYLWPLCALIQAANETEVLKSESPVFDTIFRTITDNYYNSAPPSPGYQAYVSSAGKDTRYYDDNQWIGIALMDAFSRSGNKNYLDKAAEIYRFMMTGYDTISGGGIYWREGDNSTKNTCSNGPGILLALQLFNATGDKDYLKNATDLFGWVNNNLKSPEGFYYDAVKVKEMKIDSAVYTYNTGTMLQSYVLFYNISKDQKYLDEAHRIAAAAKKKFYVNNKLPDHYWFNAVLLRGFIELSKADGNFDQIAFIADEAERIWNVNRDENGLVGKRLVKTLIDQAAMLEIFARLKQVEK